MFDTLSPVLLRIGGSQGGGMLGTYTLILPDAGFGDTAN